MVRKKKPSEVKILGQRFSIEYKEELKEDDEHLYGNTDTRDFKITIGKKLHKTDESLEATLLHETVHGILGVSGVSELLDEKLEEAIVIAIENGLRNLYTRNY